VRFLRWLFAHLFPRATSASSASRSFGPYRNAAWTGETSSPSEKTQEGAEAEVLLSYARTCPFCGNTDYTNGSPCVLNSVCRPAERVKGCKWKETHVHRACQVCKAAWLSKLPEEKKK